MNLVMLNTFVVATQAGSIAAAAKKLSYSDSTVSYHIREVEKLCRARLYEREMWGFHLTKEGRLVLDVSRRLLLVADELNSVAAPSQIAQVAAR